MFSSSLTFWGSGRGVLMIHPSFGVGVCSSSWFIQTCKKSHVFSLCYLFWTITLIQQSWTSWTKQFVVLLSDWAVEITRFYERVLLRSFPSAVEHRFIVLNGGLIYLSHGRCFRSGLLCYRVSGACLLCFTLWLLWCAPWFGSNLYARLRGGREEEWNC